MQQMFIVNSEVLIGKNWKKMCFLELSWKKVQIQQSSCLAAYLGKFHFWLVLLQGAKKKRKDDAAAAKNRFILLSIPQSTGNQTTPFARTPKMLMIHGSNIIRTYLKLRLCTRCMQVDSACTTPV
eukprot:1161471-Pelagomonas_calceolata.AAC.9